MAPAEIEPHAIPGGPSGEVSLTLVRPLGTTGSLPAVVYTHGGGWILGTFATHERLVRELAAQTGAAFVYVNYTPSPEARYPVAIEQSYAALTWVAEHGAELGLDGRRLAVAGDSVGGNMTAAVTLLAKERGGPALRVTLELPPRAGGPKRLEIRVAPPAGPAAQQPAANADDGEPTWEDAEWQ